MVENAFPNSGPIARNASTAAADAIREAIVAGRLAPGQRLAEESLARELGISRTPIREALLVLQTEGFVEAQPNRGATVRAYGVEELEDIFQLRALLEGHAAKRAATRIGGRELARLHTSNDRFGTFEPETGMRELVRENRFFHQTLLKAAGSERLAGMVRQVVELPLVYTSYIWYSPEQCRISEHYHRRITLALEARDPERAESLMREHVLEARDVLIPILREREQELGGAGGAA